MQNDRYSAEKHQPECCTSAPNPAFRCGDQSRFTFYCCSPVQSRTVHFVCSRQGGINLSATQYREAASTLTRTTHFSRLNSFKHLFNRNVARLIKTRANSVYIVNVLFNRNVAYLTRNRPSERGGPRSYAASLPARWALSQESRYLPAELLSLSRL